MASEDVERRVAEPSGLLEVAGVLAPRALGGRMRLRRAARVRVYGCMYL
jgi:hypothetical protein